MIHLECPGCAATFSVPDANAGKTGKCPKCGTQFAIPAADAAPGQESVEVRPCPGCQARIAVARGDLGTTVECPYCVTRFLAEAADRIPPLPRPPRENRPSSHSRPARQSQRRDETDDDLDDEDDDRPRRRQSRRRPSKPGNIATIGVLLLVGGIISLCWTVGTMFFTSALTCGICCLWPGFYLAPVWGILAIIRGTAMMNGRDTSTGPPTVLLGLQILLILNFDMINMVLGIVGLVLANNEDVREYYAGNYGHPGE